MLLVLSCCILVGLQIFFRIVCEENVGQRRKEMLNLRSTLDIMSSCLSTKCRHKVGISLCWCEFQVNAESEARKAKTVSWSSEEVLGPPKRIMPSSTTSRFLVKATGTPLHVMLV